MVRLDVAENRELITQTEAMQSDPSSASEHEALFDELQKTKEALVVEKRRSMDVVNEMKRMKERNLAIQKQVEQEEEYITNTLMKRLQQARKEKEKISNEVENEEEYLVNNLQKRLQKLNTEKLDVEMQLQIEQDAEAKLKQSVEELKEQFRQLSKQKVDLENQLEAEQEYIVNKLGKQVEELKKEKSILQEERRSLCREKDVMADENSSLRRHVAELAETAEQLSQERFRIEALKEMEEENISNRLQRQIEYLVGYVKQASAALEKKGIILNELVPLHLDSTAEETYGRSPTHRSSSAGSSRRSSMGKRNLSLRSPTASAFMPSVMSAPSGSLRSPELGVIDRSMFRQREQDIVMSSPST